MGNHFKMAGSPVDASRRGHLFAVCVRFAVHQLGWVTDLGPTARHFGSGAVF